MDDFWLVKTDPVGVMMWNKMYGGVDIRVRERDQRFKGIVE